MSVSKRNNEEEFIKVASIQELVGFSAEQLCDVCEIGQSVPVMFNEITRRYDFDIRGADLSHEQVNGEQINGVAMIANKSPGNTDAQYQAKLLYANQNTVSIPDQRFIIAHEIAHVVRNFNEMISPEGEGHQKIFYDGPERTLSPDQRAEEQQCNKFARALLMPKSIFVYCYVLECSSTGVCGTSGVRKLAGLFLVPDVEVRRRIDELGLKVVE